MEKIVHCSTGIDFGSLVVLFFGVFSFLFFDVHWRFCFRYRHDYLFGIGMRSGNLFSVIFWGCCLIGTLTMGNGLYFILF